MAKRRDLVLGGLNVLAIAAYLVRASHDWTIPEERGLDGMTAEPFVWALYALPVLLAAAVVDVAWGLALTTRYGTTTGRRIHRAVVLAWLLAVVLDFSRHRRDARVRRELPHARL